MTSLQPFQRAHAIELRCPSEDGTEGHSLRGDRGKPCLPRWPMTTEGKKASKAYFVKFGPRPSRRVIATDFLCGAKLFFAWDDHEGAAQELIATLEKKGWIPTLVEVIAATDLPTYSF